jgi:hypothetical protein
MAFLQALLIFIVSQPQAEPRHALLRRLAAGAAAAARTYLGAVVDVCCVKHVGQVLQAHVQAQPVRLQDR